MAFPTSIGADQYYIVKISFPYGYSNTNLPEVLNDYAFVFNTIYSNKKDNGLSNVQIVPINTLLLFNAHVQDAAKLIYSGGNLVVNDFIEIVQEETNHDKKYIAVLKKQMSKENTYEFDKRILLLTNNHHVRKPYNIPVLQLGSEFENSIKRYKAEERLEKIRGTCEYLKILQHRSTDEDYKLALSKAIELASAEEKVQKDTVSQLYKFDISDINYID